MNVDKRCSLHLSKILNCATGHFTQFLIALCVMGRNERIPQWSKGWGSRCFGEMLCGESFMCSSGDQQHPAPLPSFALYCTGLIVLCVFIEQPFFEENPKSLLLLIQTVCSQHIVRWPKNKVLQTKKHNLFTEGREMASISRATHVLIFHDNVWLVSSNMSLCSAATFCWINLNFLEQKL